MADWAYNETELQLRKLEKELASLYNALDSEIADDLAEYIAEHEKQIKEKQKQLNDGFINQKQFKNGLIMLLATGAAWKRFRDKTAQKYTSTNQKAVNIINGYVPKIYNINSIYSAYQIANALGIKPKLIKTKYTITNWIKKKSASVYQKLKTSKDLRWNKQKIKAAIMQGIGSGGILSKLKKSFKRVTEMNHNNAIRNAWNGTTKSQNAGRLDRYEEARDNGVDIQKRWETMRDGRVRLTHSQLSGDTIDIHSIFSNGCLYPGDTAHGAPPREYSQCRCMLLPVIDGTVIDDYDLYYVSEFSPYAHSIGYYRLSYAEWRDKVEERARRGS